jgi:GNAT superfamily N-acetyltransferase
VTTFRLPGDVDLRIRAARRSDLPALRELHEQLPGALGGHGPVRAIGADGCRALLVERPGGGVVAYGVVQDVGAPRAPVAIAIAAGYRGAGLAGILVERLAAAAWAEGTRRVVVYAPVRRTDLRMLLRLRCMRR